MHQSELRVGDRDLCNMAIWQHAQKYSSDTGDSEIMRTLCQILSPAGNLAKPN